MKWLVLMLLSMGVYGNPTLNNLATNMREKNTLVCVGLDPDPAKMPEELEGDVRLFLQEVIDITLPHVSCYKMQKAFFDKLENGHLFFRETVQYLKQKDPTIPVFVDCKIGDIDNTMQVYMDLLFDEMKVDGVVINPYMGDDVFLPFLQDPKKVGIVLIQTSNPSARVVQELELANGKMLWEELLELMLERWNVHNNLIPVLSSHSDIERYANIRHRLPANMPILLAGIGSQGGDPRVLQELLTEERSGVFVNSSRGILYPYEPSDSQWREKIKHAVVALKAELNGVRYEK